MSETSRLSSSRLFQAVGQAIMGFLMFLACWGVSHYVGIQNRNLVGTIRSNREQIQAGRLVSENYEKFLAAVADYIKVTRDQNMVVILQQSGVAVRVQEDSPAGAPIPPGAAPPAGKASEPQKAGK